MNMSDYANFFLASAGAGAALMGLLFVAISITPEGTVLPTAPRERQVVASGAFTAFTNAFFVSLGAPDNAYTHRLVSLCLFFHLTY
jgi:hypothetical protein